MRDPMWLYLIGFAVGLWFGGKIEREWLIANPKEFFLASAKSKKREFWRVG